MAKAPEGVPVHDKQHTLIELARQILGFRDGAHVSLMMVTPPRPKISVAVSVAIMLWVAASTQSQQREAAGRAGAGRKTHHSVSVPYFADNLK